MDRPQKMCPHFRAVGALGSFFGGLSQQQHTREATGDAVKGRGSKGGGEWRKIGSGGPEPAEILIKS